MSIWDKPIAHRGLHGGDIPENSMLAFERAVDNGYNIELDVHITLDGVVVVFHDDTLTRVCGVDKKIADCTKPELDNYTLANTDLHIPTLVEVLDMVDNRVEVLVEIKSTDSKVGRLESATYDIIKNYTNISIQSFNPMSVKWYKDNAPSIPRGILATGEYPGQKWPVSYMLKAMWFNGLIKPEFIAYDERFLLTSKYLPRKRKGLKVLSWTVSSEDRYDQIKHLVDNVIFENWTP
ncbi:MAG: glycerophosphodiester phosphodiesterase [Clostridia bacterium]|nr:glycerophosphodiester phosphodiesterase [Clostridia bacterium]